MTEKGIGITLVLAVIVAGSAGVFLAWWLSPGNVVVPPDPLASTSTVPIRAVSTDIPRLIDSLQPPTSVAAAQPAATGTTPAMRSVSVIAFGDSVTAGYGLSLSSAYPAILERALVAEGFDVRVTNMGVSGDTTAAGARRVDFAIKADPDIVIVALGGNDMLRGVSPSVTRAELSRIVGAFRAADIEVLLVGMRAQQNLGGTYVEEFESLYPDVAREHGVPLVPFLLEGVALDAGLNQPDGIHPTAEGQRIIAERNILPLLRPIVAHAAGTAQ